MGIVCGWLLIIVCFVPNSGFHPCDVECGIKVDVITLSVAGINALWADLYLYET